MKNTNMLLGLCSILIIGTLFSGCNTKQLVENNSELIEEKANNSSEYDETNCTTITLNDSNTDISGEGAEISDSVLTITKEGSYILNGTFNGMVIVDTTKDSKVQLILDNVKISKDSSAPIYVKQADEVTLTLPDGSENTITNTGDFVAIDEEDINAAIYSNDDIEINGNGSLTISSEKGHGIKSSDDVIITNGNITINAAKDGVHGKEHVQIDNGNINIDAAEGIEGTIITINDGGITIDASDDGINAAAKAEDLGTPTVEINGGNLTINMASGDTDGIDANGDLYINGGTVIVNAQSPFDYDGVAEHNGGTIIVNGEKIEDITNQFGNMGPGGFENPGDFDPNNMPEDFNPGNRPERPDGFKGKGDKEPPADFDPNNLPENFDKRQKPETEQVF